MPLAVSKIFRDLSSLEFRVLAVIEVLMAKYELVPVEEVVGYLRFTEKKTTAILQRLRRIKLITIRQQHYLGVALTFAGYDALALKTLIERGTLAQIGPEIGAGKESNIYMAVNDDHHEFLIKFHRLGKLDFRTTRKHRAFIAEKRHLSPLYESRLSAEREYNALVALYNAKVSVPKPITHNRHLVVMEIVMGEDLYRIKKNLFSEEEIIKLIDEIFDEIRKAAAIGYIHGDLSEYNIRLNEEGYPVLFDWPQHVTPDFEQAEEILIRDIQNVLRYFESKFQMKMPLEVSQILEEIYPS